MSDHVYTLDRGPAIMLGNGVLFPLLDPDPTLFSARTIARSLSKLCRFTGHTRVFYSVAQHCVMVSRILPYHLALSGLLHDASEAFIGDVTRPLKDVLEQAAPGVLFGIEDRIHLALAMKFGTEHPHDPRVKVADNIALATEIRDLMPIGRGGEWPDLPAPLDERITPFSPNDAADQWLAEYHLLTRRPR